MKRSFFQGQQGFEKEKRGKEYLKMGKGTKNGKKKRVEIEGGRKIPPTQKKTLGRALGQRDLSQNSPDRKEPGGCTKRQQYPKPVPSKKTTNNKREKLWGLRGRERQKRKRKKGERPTSSKASSLGAREPARERRPRLRGKSREEGGRAQKVEDGGGSWASAGPRFFAESKKR